jgi:hypothetical protein
MTEASPRDEALVALRPSVDAHPERAATPEERFLHATLRPVLKLQNDSLLRLAAASVAARVPGFPAFDPADQERRLRQMLAQDRRLKHVLYGVVLGALTAEEIQFFLDHEREMRRRLGALVAERVASQRSRLLAYVEAESE